jgi:hypothetical protein
LSCLWLNSKQKKEGLDYDRCGFPALGVDEFLKGKKSVSRLDASEVEFKQAELPATTQIMVLKPAL